MASTERRLIVVVTGANSGVGLGICERLILQLSGGLPDLDDPTHNTNLSSDTLTSAHSLTLVLACRNKGRAEAAKEKCLRLLEKSGDVNGFGKKLKIEPADLDLSRMESVYKFCLAMKAKYGYITHLFLNAGTGNFTAVNWPLCFYQILTEGTPALVFPRYKVQGLGAMTDDGFGLVWQSNVLGHFMMVRQLTALLAASPFHDSRVIWTASVEADLGSFDADDWQLFHSPTPYEATKYQQTLLSVQMDLQFAEREDTRHIRCFVIDPGVVASSIYTQTLGWFLDKAMILAFWLARWVGSSYHVISPFKGAVAAIYIALVMLSRLPKVGEPIRHSSRVDWLGRERVVVEPIAVWDPKKAEDLAGKCDRLCNALVEKFSHHTQANGVANGASHANGSSKT